MEELQARHRKEQRDLQSQITQKKKSASKKTRKAVNDECARLEQELKDRQRLEATDIAGDSDSASPAASRTNGHDPPLPEDDDLLASLVSETTLQPTTANSPDPVTPNDPSEGDTTLNSSSKKPNRQKARLARRAAEQSAASAAAASEAANLPDLKTQERARMLTEFKKRGLTEKVVAANGHCLYSAVADQVRQLGLALGAADDLGGRHGEEEEGEERLNGELRNEDYRTVRARAAAFMAEHAVEFVPFLEEPLNDYVRKIRDTGEWGGQLELLALAKSYNLKIRVLQGDGRVEDIESGESDVRGEAWLAYYRHGFGLGEHYNSLKKSDVANGETGG